MNPKMAMLKPIAMTDHEIFPSCDLSISYCTACDFDLWVSNESLRFCPRAFIIGRIEEIIGMIIPNMVAPNIEFHESILLRELTWKACLNLVIMNYNLITLK